MENEPDAGFAPARQLKPGCRHKKAQRARQGTLRMADRESERLFGQQDARVVAILLVKQDADQADRNKQRNKRKNNNNNNRVHNKPPC
jgi:hypothetical protein